MERGTVIAGRFELLDPVDEGSMGRVWLARQLGIDRQVAVKLMHPELARDPELVERFRREMRVTAQAAHPNTVIVHDYGTTAEGLHYLALEYLDGNTLSEILAHDGRFPVPRAVHVTAQIARALGAAHARAVVHRDLKPDNVFLCERYGQTDWVKLLDFGLALADDRGSNPGLTVAGKRVGTPAYMAPEYVRGTQPDHRADLYAVGVLLFEMLTGEPPFSGTDYEVLARHVDDPAPRPSSRAPAVPRWLDEVVLRCLEKDPARRYPEAFDLLQALGEADPASATTWGDDGPRTIPGVTRRVQRQTPPSKPDLGEMVGAPGPRGQAPHSLTPAPSAPGLLSAARGSSAPRDNPLLAELRPIDDRPAATATHAPPPRTTTWWYAMAGIGAGVVVGAVGGGALLGWWLATGG